MFHIVVYVFFDSSQAHQRVSIPYPIIYQHMKYSLPLSLLGLAMCAATTVTAQSTTDQCQSLGDGMVRAISPNGKYVVGNASAMGTEAFHSYVWDATSKKQQWPTSYDETDLTKSGQFLSINDDSVIVGAVKDPNLTKYFPGDDWSDPYTYTFVSAAVWRNDEVTKLGLGSHDVEELADEFDGTYANSISADGNTIAGYLYRGYMACVPCGWRYDATKDTYSYYEYTLPDVAGVGSINALSADGKVAVGTVSYNGVSRPAVWTSPEACTEMTLDVDVKDIWNGAATAVSSNGRYVLVHINSATLPRIGVYDVVNQTTNTIMVPDAYEAKGLTIDDEGNFFFQVTDNKQYLTKTYYWSKDQNVMVDMDYYRTTFAPNVDSETINTSAIPVSVAADGHTLVGYNNNYGIFSSWWLQVDPNGEMAPGVDNVKLYASALNQMTVSWDAVSNTEELTLKQYDLYVDGSLVTNASEVNVGQDVVKVQLSATAGKHEAYVVCQYVKGDAVVASPPSQKVSLSLPSSYALPMTDDFESQSFDTNCWTKELVSGAQGEILMWNVAGGNFENNTYFASVTNTSDEPYEATLTSHFFDATELSNPYVVFYGNMTYVNAIRQDLSSDILSLQYSLDGENWTSVYDLNAASVTPYAWNFYKVDLPQLSGKAFQIRFNAHGEGKGKLRWALDYVTIANTLTGEAPQGVTATTGDNKVSLTWQNSMQAYEASYLCNSNVLADYNIGNEGNPLMVAIDLPAEKLSQHIGRYITSVTSFVYDDPSLYSAQSTQAEAIIYADGVEVARQAFATDASSNAYPCTVVLDKPILIEDAVDYRVAVRIHDYDAQQSPLYYQSSSDDYITGVTDLYSEDEGKTWQTIYNFNKDNTDGSRAYCIWPIRANITDQATAPATALDPALLAYNVYRNGQWLNTTAVYAPYLQYVDHDPLTTGTAEYAVQAFYTDGRVSPLSTPCSVTAIKSTFADKALAVNVDSKGRTLQIEGAFDQAALYATDGKKVATFTAPTLSTTSIKAGVYILQVLKGAQKATYKVVIR